MNEIKGKRGREEDDGNRPERIVAFGFIITGAAILLLWILLLWILLLRLLLLFRILLILGGVTLRLLGGGIGPRLHAIQRPLGELQVDLRILEVGIEAHGAADQCQCTAEAAPPRG